MLVFFLSIPAERKSSRIYQAFVVISQNPFENHYSWPLVFGIHNDITNPKTASVIFLIPRRFDVTIPLRKSEWIRGLKKG